MQFIFSSIFSLFYGFLSCFSLSNPLFLSLLFLVFSYVFVEHQCFWFQKTQVENTNFWSKGELQQNGFFNNQCFERCEKLSFFPLFFGQILVDVQKHCKNWYFSTFQKQQKEKMTILQGYCLGQVRVIIWAKFVAT